MSHSYTPENQRFSDILKGYWNGKLDQNGLILQATFGSYLLESGSEIWAEWRIETS